MNLYGKELIAKFQLRHSQSRKPLEEWVSKTESAQWNTFADIKKTFNTTDYLSPYCIFDVGGNKFRIIAIVSFTEKTLLIDKILTHPEYDRWKPK